MTKKDLILIIKIFFMFVQMLFKAILVVLWLLLPFGVAVEMRPIETKAGWILLTAIIVIWGPFSLYVLWKLKCRVLGKDADGMSVLRWFYGVHVQNDRTAWLYQPVKNKESRGFNKVCTNCGWDTKDYNWRRIELVCRPTKCPQCSGALKLLLKLPCPRCDGVCSRFCRPATIKHWFRGGLTCEKCRCAVNQRGEVVD